MSLNPEMKRTHRCSELRESHVGQTITVCGWVHRRRDHGGISFIDLRDRSGLLQAVCNVKKNPSVHSQINALGIEYVVALTGLVSRRPKGMENPKLASGMVEIDVKSLTVLNSSSPPPFEIDEQIDISEEVRMAWRYIDLRRASMQENLRLRHKVSSSMRKTLDERGFIEVETPILTKSTPEGARDYLVPSRVNPGKFFALPQSPQLFKQLLMAGGLEQYFQFARCFRDEDLRADRQPEFTQLDIEISFIEEEDVMGLLEEIVFSVFKDNLGIELKRPFPRLTHKEAMEKYKTDAPNLKTEDQPWAFCWITEFPLFSWNQEANRWDSEHHPFTAPHPEDLQFLKEDPGRLRARAYDLILNGVELGSGSIRIHTEKLQREIFGILGLTEDVVQERFGFLLQAFGFGTPPHGGFALGLDRFLALMTGTSSIREVIAFPKTQKAVDLLVNAPSHVTNAQLKELGIVVVNTQPSVSRST